MQLQQTERPTDEYCITGKKDAVVKAWEEGKLVLPNDGHPGHLSSRAADHKAWMRAEMNTYEIEYEEVGFPLDLYICQKHEQICQATADHDRHICQTVHNSLISFLVGVILLYQSGLGHQSSLSHGRPAPAVPANHGDLQQSPVSDRVILGDFLFQIQGLDGRLKLLRLITAKQALQQASQCRCVCCRVLSR